MNLEFYETPQTFGRWLFREMDSLGFPIRGSLCEPAVGSGALVRAAESINLNIQRWITNDIDSQWKADFHYDATTPELWEVANSDNIGIDFTVSNTPWSLGIPIAIRAIEHSRVGVALLLRASIHEVCKTGIRRRWLAENTPNGILWLPRFAYERSPTTFNWSVDSVCPCWVIWLKECKQQFIRYAPESLLEELESETTDYRRRMDDIMRDYAVRI